jgi:hypothetical protein
MSLSFSSKLQGKQVLTLENQLQQKTTKPSTVKEVSFFEVQGDMYAPITNKTTQLF